MDIRTLKNTLLYYYFLPVVLTFVVSSVGWTSWGGYSDYLVSAFFGLVVGGLTVCIRLMTIVIRFDRVV